MKAQNLARRVAPESFEESPRQQPPVDADRPSPADAAERARRPPRFGRRTIEIRDQGLAPFRVR